MTDAGIPMGEGRQAATHNVKCWPGVFDEMRAGRKTAEYRLNDRDYQVGDTLLIREWCPDRKEYTHREITRLITHVLKDGFGVPAGYAMLSLAFADTPPPAAAPWDAAILADAQEHASTLDPAISKRPLSPHLAATPQPIPAPAEAGERELAREADCEFCHGAWMARGCCPICEESGSPESLLSARQLRDAILARALELWEEVQQLKTALRTPEPDSGGERSDG